MDTRSMIMISDGFNIQKYLRMLQIPCYAIAKREIYTTLKDSPQPHCSAVKLLVSLLS
jgi:hypothetical protein